MELRDIMEIIVLPVLGWLLMNSNKVQRRLTRIETMLEFIVKHNHKKDH